MLYTKVLKPILFNFSPDRVHEGFTNIGEFLGNYGWSKKLVSAVYGYHGPDISKTVDGIKYRTPILLSAGFDYNARLTHILPYLGFGGVEVGSVTARPCLGNPKPQLTRLPKNKSIVVYKGLKNEGVDKIISRLQKNTIEPNFVIGVSIARTNDSNSATTEAGIADYCESFEKLNRANVGDYYTINISCPNAYGGEAYTTPTLLDQLLAELSEIKCIKPVYLKMPINLSWSEFDGLLKVAEKTFIKGVIIGNLNKNYEDLEFREEAPEKFRGGLSGKPTWQLSNELIRQTRKNYGSRFTIMGVGGIMSTQQAMEKFEAGADLIQLITGMIYEGPGLISSIARTYSQKMKSE